jgi:hypothetical protein
MERKHGGGGKMGFDGLRTVKRTSNRCCGRGHKAQPGGPKGRTDAEGRKASCRKRLYCSRAVVSTSGMLKGTL